MKRTRLQHQSMRTLRGVDGLGLDLSPFVTAATQLATSAAQTYSTVEAAKNASKPATPAGIPMPAGGGGGGGKPAASSKTLDYLLIGLAVLGGGFIAWRAFGPRGSRGRR